MGHKRFPISIRIRLTITLTLLGVLLVGGYTLIDYRSERADLYASAQNELRYVGRSLQIAMGNALRDGQPRDVQETFAALEKTAPAIDLYVYDASGQPAGASEGAVLDDAITAITQEVAGTREEVLRIDDHTGHLLYSAPLSADDGRFLGTVTVSRPLLQLHQNLGRRRHRMALIVLAFVALMSATGTLLGTAYISRPLMNVLAGIRHVRHGDFKSRIALEREDEVGALVHEFNEMVAALDGARRQAEDANEARARVERSLQHIDKIITLGQLSAGLAHEIGSPLQVLRGRAAVVLETSSDPEARRHAGILVEQCDRIAGIVEQLLSFVRRKPAKIAPCDLEVPIRTVVELLSGEARRAGVTIKVEIDAADHVVDADADQIQQVVLNLVKNALAATPRGGSITVQLAADGARSLSLIVRDTGPGIPMEMQSRLFEPFFTTRVSEGGTGLGLAVVRAIVCEHGGSVEVRSDIARGGAEFVVHVPVRTGVVEHHV